MTTMELGSICGNRKRAIDHRRKAHKDCSEIEVVGNPSKLVCYYRKDMCISSLKITFIK
jgi:hypothetical protein